MNQVCYRVLMQLCGQYGHPALAVKVSIIAVVSDTGRVNVCTYVYVGTKEQHLRLLLFFLFITSTLAGLSNKLDRLVENSRMKC